MTRRATVLKWIFYCLCALALLLGREALVSLPFAAAAHPLFRWVQRRTLSE